MEDRGGPIGSGTASASGDPGRGPGTKDSFDEDEDEEDRDAFLLDLFLTTGPENASSSEQNALLMTPLLEVKFFSVILDPHGLN